MTSDAFPETGVRHYPCAVPAAEVAAIASLADLWLEGRPGRRLRPGDWLDLPVPLKWLDYGKE